ncbi:hypothetical protein SAY86_022361 [Trapa natans]|uniref:S-adenosyl-L-methionine-dependent methyltransferase superfamily protein n=1 Tax=Trapa natans TaxID=22666 RepID=A0AAN7R968_TRANT|nr:hypothetical protein SAY86_022361 [Trapa natans]
MGKREKKQRHQRHPRREASHYLDEENEGGLSSDCFSGAAPPPSLSDEEPEELEEDEETLGNDQTPASSSAGIPSKFQLYQQSVQSPKGDITYLQKFFLMYVGGRHPLHLQEDFCGTALLSAEWLRTDPRRTSIGLDLDLEALDWCMENNVSKIGADGYSRISLFHGNVLQPQEAKLVNFEPAESIKNLNLNPCDNEDSALQEKSPESVATKSVQINWEQLPSRDIICAFNYSCCCLHSRKDLVLYFRHVLGALSKKGGIFVMDLYGGTSSEQKLRLQRKFPNFTYTWEQAEFDIIERKTRISLHFYLQKQQKKIRNAFSYSWRLWSLPEIKDCLQEAGFKFVHFWLREMPDVEENRSTVGFGAGRDVKYEEVESFQQQDAWNAYIVGVTK